MKQMSYQIPYLDGEFSDNNSIDARIYRLMSPRYTLFLDRKTASIRHLVYAGNAPFDPAEDFITTYSVIEEGKAYPMTEVGRGAKTCGIRVIEEGHSCLRFDVPLLRYAGAEKFYGTIETVAYPEHFALNYEMYSTEEVDDVTLRMTVELKRHTIKRVGRNRLLATTPEKENLLFAAAEPGVSLTAEGNTVVMTRKHVHIAAKRYEHAGILVVPTRRLTYIDFEKIFALNDAVSVKGEMTSPDVQPADGERDLYGNCRINITPRHWNGDVTSTPAARNLYQKVRFTVTNDSDRDLLVPICFAYGHENTYRTRIPISGLSPMIRRNGVPTGIQVQLCKTWDGCANDELVYDDPALLKQGYWMRSTALIPAPRHSAEEYEYFCAFENYGGVAAAQSAQLGLMGWGWCYHQWDQVAVGSHGETICYNAQGLSMIQDIRPLYVRSAAAGMHEYDWPGNVGGADFLTYRDPGESYKVVWPTMPRNTVTNTVTEYRAQCPILTDVIFRGITRDGKIATTYNVMTASSDDVPRHYHILRYEFKEDTAYTRLSFYSHPSDGLYMPPCQRKLAFGTDDKRPLVRKCHGNYGYYDRESFRHAHFPTGRYPWAFAYDADFIPYTPGIEGCHTDKPEEQANAGVLAIVRRLKGRVNGRRVTKLDYSLSDHDTWKRHNFGYELVLPRSFGDTVSAGSWIELTVEMVTLPDDPAAYYGNSPVILDNMDKLNTAAIAPVFALGNALSFDMALGKLTRTYPPRIRCAKGKVLAQFTMHGGLGYTPLSFTGITVSPEKLELQIKLNGVFTRLTKETDTGEEHDDMQVMRTDRGYEVVFAVKNARFTSGNNEYRLIVKD